MGLVLVFVAIELVQWKGHVKNWLVPSNYNRLARLTVAGLEPNLQVRDNINLLLVLWISALC
jgi:hypothetical protein